MSDQPGVEAAVDVSALSFDDALLELQRKSIETADLVVRIEALEASGGLAAAPPGVAARVRRVLDERLRGERP